MVPSYTTTRPTVVLREGRGESRKTTVPEGLVNFNDDVLDTPNLVRDIEGLEGVRPGG